MFLLNLGLVDLTLGDLERAPNSICNEGRSASSWCNLALILQALGRVALRRGDLEAARRRFCEGFVRTSAGEAPPRGKAALRTSPSC